MLHRRQTMGGGSYLMCLTESANFLVCQLGKSLSHWIQVLLITPWVRFYFLSLQNHPGLQHVAFLWCQMDGTSLSLPSTRSGHELEHLPQWLLLLILLWNMLSIWMGNSMKCGQNRTCIYAQAPSVRVRQHKTDHMA